MESIHWRPLRQDFGGKAERTILDKRRLRGHLIAVFYLKANYKEDGDGLLSVAVGDRARSNDLKLKEGKFRLEIRKIFLIMRVVKHWKARVRMYPRSQPFFSCLDLLKRTMEVTNNLSK